MKTFINSTLIEAGNLLNSQCDMKQVVKYKETTNSKKEISQIVTSQDIMIEDFIINRIEKEFPNTNIISEEQSVNDFSLEKPTWVIDPIDGSLNYYRGINFFCLSISFWENHEPKYAGVYSPFNNELFHASKGRGATLNNMPIKVSNLSTVDESIIILSGFESFKKQKKERQFFNIVQRIKNMRIFSSSVLDTCYIAAGRCEGRVYSYCKFWDLSAAKLILEEAGGRLTDWQGESKNIFSPLIIASNGYIHNQLMEIINHENT